MTVDPAGRSSMRESARRVAVAITALLLALVIGVALIALL